MKNLFIVMSLFTFVPASAQFDAVKYFSDSVSFAYEQHIVTTKRGKESKISNKFQFIVRLQDDQLKLLQITTGDKGITNGDRKIYTLADITSLDLNQPAIEENKEPNYSDGKTIIKGSTKPTEVYFLIVEQIGGTPDFKTYGESEYPRSIAKIYLYFPSAAEAQEAVKWLKAKQDDIVKQSKQASPSFADFVPPSNCGNGTTQYINKTFGFTLCVDDNERASELTYEKFNYQFLKDFVLIKGFSDLPFYVCPIINKTENDMKQLFEKFENEFFDRIGAQNVISKAIYKDDHTEAAPPDVKETHFRGYTITLQSGQEANVCFEYLLGGGSTRFQVLCFAYMAPTGINGLSYSLRNSARVLECQPFNFY